MRIYTQYTVFFGIDKQDKHSIKTESDCGFLQGLDKHSIKTESVCGIF